MSSAPENVKVVLDVAAGSAVLGVILQWLPLVLAIPSAVYACLRVYEWFEKRRAR